MKNKNIKVTFGICISSIILMVSCKNDSTTNNINNDSKSTIPEIIATALNANDSLQQFANTFKLLSITNADVASGITILALTNNALINPLNPENLKEYIIKGIVTPTDLLSGKGLTSITGNQITLTNNNGHFFANGSMISSSPVIISKNYYLYSISGLYSNSGISKYDDPHKNEYYVSFYLNGNYINLKGSDITTWQFFSTNNFPTPVEGNCSYPTYNSYSSGPSLVLQAFAVDNPFWLQINRKNFTSLPITGEYTISSATYDASQNINTGNCNLVIYGAVFGCNLGDNDSYVHVKITEVKVDQNLGIEKRGYYKGEFDAILYYTARQGAVANKKIITSGSFMVPMGGNESTPLNGTPTSVDRMAILTTGKWYFKPTVEVHLNDSTFAPCNIDDYIVFRTNGTCDWKDGNIVCDPNVSGIDHGDNIPWVFKNNQTVIHFGDINGDDMTITEISNSTLVLGGIKFANGN